MRMSIDMLEPGWPAQEQWPMRRIHRLEALSQVGCWHAYRTDKNVQQT